VWARQERLVYRVPDLRDCTSALRSGAEGAGPRTCSIVVAFTRPGVVHRECTGRADDRKREAEGGSGARAARVCLRKRVAQRVRERGGNDEVGEREDRAR
jgi:hypothetical protein